MTQQFTFWADLVRFRAAYSIIVVFIGVEQRVELSLIHQVLFLVAH